MQSADASADKPTGIGLTWRMRKHRSVTDLRQRIYIPVSARPVVREIIVRKIIKIGYPFFK